MSRGSYLAWLVGAALLLAPIHSPPTRAEEDREAFIEALRNAGYYDVVVAYIEQQLRERSLGAEEREALTFELAQALLDAAAHEPDLQKRAALLDRSQRALREYLNRYQEGVYAAKAEFELARLQFERGRLLAAQAEKADSPAQVRARWHEAREAFREAQERFRQAAALFQKQLRQYPLHVDPNRTVEIAGRRLPGRVAARLRSEAEVNRILAQFHDAMVDFEYAHTFPEGTAERRAKLEEAEKKFERIYQLYRTVLAGLHARMWMARCLDELGETRKALGLYEELLRHDPADQPNSAARAALTELQRRVRAFWIAAQNRLGNYQLALDAAREWLRRNRRQRYSETGQTILWELARAARGLYSKLPDNSPQRRALLREAIDAWAELARQDSPYRQLAVAELQRWAGVEQVSGRRELTFAAAVSLATQALEAENWAEAERLYGIALTLRHEADNSYQVNDARLRRAYALYRLGKQLEAAVIAEHIVWRYPGSGLAKSAAYLALVSLWSAYREALQQRNPVVSSGLLPHIEQLATTVVDRWPTSREADFARSLLGHIAWRNKDWRGAARWYEAVSPSAEGYVKSMLRAAEAWWQVYISQARGTAESAEILSRCQKAAEAARTAHGDQLNKDASQRPPSLVQADLLLARVMLEQGNVEEVRRLIEPYFVVAFVRDDLGALREQLLTVLLQAHLMAGDLEAAQRVLAMMERSDTTGLRQLMAQLADRLADEAERLKQAGQADLAEERAQAFARLVYQLLEDRALPAEVLFGFVPSLSQLGQHEAAIRAAQQLVQTTRSDRRKNRAARLLLAQALRAAGRYRDAAGLLLSADRRSGLLAENPRAVDAIMEYGRVLTWWGLEEASRLKEASRHWNRYTRLLSLARRRPDEYYQAWCYLILTELARGQRGGTGSRQRARALARYGLQTSPAADLDRRIQGPGWADLLRLAEKLGLRRPRELDTVRDVLEWLHGQAGGRPGDSPAPTESLR